MLLSALCRAAWCGRSLRIQRVNLLLLVSSSCVYWLSIGTVKIHWSGTNAKINWSRLTSKADYTYSFLPAKCENSIAPDWNIYWFQTKPKIHRSQTRPKMHLLLTTAKSIRPSQNGPKQRRKFPFLVYQSIGARNFIFINFCIPKK